jgi:hypothetical protein
MISSRLRTEEGVKSLFTRRAAWGHESRRAPAAAGAGSMAITTDFDAGVLLISATLLSATRGFVSG